MYNELIKRLHDAAKIYEWAAILLPDSKGSATAELYNEAADAIEELQKRIPKTPHGRLIDADAVTFSAMENILMWEDAGCDRDDYRTFLANYIDDAPTIIPAEKGE